MARKLHPNLAAKRANKREFLPPKLRMGKAAASIGGFNRPAPGAALAAMGLPTGLADPNNNNVIDKLMPAQALDSANNQAGNSTPQNTAAPATPAAPPAATTPPEPAAAQGAPASGAASSAPPMRGANPAGRPSLGVRRVGPVKPPATPITGAGAVPGAVVVGAWRTSTVGKQIGAYNPSARREGAVGTGEARTCRIGKSVRWESEAASETCWGHFAGSLLGTYGRFQAARAFLAAESERPGSSRHSAGGPC